jgi:hypothetical protein
MLNRLHKMGSKSSASNSARRTPFLTVLRDLIEVRELVEAPGIRNQVQHWGRYVGTVMLPMLSVPSRRPVTSNDDEGNGVK